MDATKEQRIIEAAKLYHGAKKKLEAVQAESRPVDPAADEDRTVREAKAMAECNEAKSKVSVECGTPPAPQVTPHLVVAAQAAPSFWVAWRQLIVGVVIAAVLVGAQFAYRHLT